VAAIVIHVYEKIIFRPFFGTTLSEGTGGDRRGPEGTGEDRRGRDRF
jgi:hypothetical protein